MTGASLEEHERFIRQAYQLARSAAARGNFPYGALLVRDGEVVMTAENTVISDRDPTRHAELNLVSQASRSLGPEILPACTLYTSTEPCPMCAGAIYWTGVPRIVYGFGGVEQARMAGDPFAVSSRQVLASVLGLVAIIGPVLETEGRQIHQEFLAKRSTP